MVIIKQFFQSKTANGTLMIIAAALAILIVNSPLSHLYDVLLDTPLKIQIGTLEIGKPLLIWINDGLMAIFFLFIGLEIKREILKGQLSTLSRFMLPALAAIGGLTVPILIYVYLNIDHPEAIHGWAIPAATDIAFALAILTLLGSRVPHALKITLASIAVMDDLITIIIIAFFYTESLSNISLIFVGIITMLMFTLNRLGVSKLSPYMVLGLILWVCVLKSGVHATLAGVIIGLMIPLTNKNIHKKSPLIKLSQIIHPWIYLLILPIFAFANAGVSFVGITIETLTSTVTIGIALGLFFGKQIGVMLVTWIACTLKICKLPEGVNWKNFYGMAVLTGIGFTMSLFIGMLAFSDQSYNEQVRLGVLLGSIFSAITGYLILKHTSNK